MSKHLQKTFSACLIALLCLSGNTLLANEPSTGSCNGFRTQTQGGWGTEPHGNNPGTYLYANFAAAFPAGLTIGCNGNTILLTSAVAVSDFLPSGGSPSVLPAGNMVDPTGYKNTLAGQLVAAKLNVGFDKYDATFSSNSKATGNLIFKSGTFEGWTVNQLIIEADKTIGGCSSDYAPSAINDALSTFNENYVDGTSNNGNFNCPPDCALALSFTSTKASCWGSSDASIDLTVTGAYGNVTYLWNDGTTTEDRKNITAGYYTVVVTDELECSQTITIHVKHPAKLKATSTVTPVSAYRKCDASAVINPSGGTKPYTYTWDDGYVGKSRTDLCPGHYYVTVKDKNGCEVTIKVAVYRYAGVAPTTSETSKMSVSPNPSKGQITLSLVATQNIHAVVNVIDISTSIVKKSTVISLVKGSNINQLDYSSLPNGIYQLQVVMGEKMESMKLVIE